MKKSSALIIILITGILFLALVALFFVVRKSTNFQQAIPTPTSSQSPQSAVTPKPERMSESPIEVLAITSENSVELYLVTENIELSAFALSFLLSEELAKSVEFNPNNELVDAGWTFPVNEISEDDGYSLDVAGVFVSPKGYVTGAREFLGTIDGLGSETLELDNEISAMVDKSGLFYNIKFDYE